MSNHHQVMRILVSRGRRKGGATASFSQPLAIKATSDYLETRKGVTGYTAVYNVTKLATGVPPQLTRFSVRACDYQFLTESLVYVCRMLCCVPTCDLHVSLLSSGWG